MSAGTHEPPPAEVRTRTATRMFAVVLAVLSLAFGITGLLEISPEQWGVGMVGFGVLLALLSLLAQSAEHFARSAREHGERHLQPRPRL